jgi:hypothetical protein
LTQKMFIPPRLPKDLFHCHPSIRCASFLSEEEQTGCFCAVFCNISSGTSFTSFSLKDCLLWYPLHFSIPSGSRECPTSLLQNYMGYLLHKYICYS